MINKLLHYFTSSISRQITTIYLSLSLLIIIIMTAIASVFIPRIFLTNYLTAVNNATTITANKLSDTINNIDISVSTLCASNTAFLNTLSTEYASVKEGYALHNSALSMFTKSVWQSTSDIAYFMSSFLFVDSKLPLNQFCADFSNDLFHSLQSQYIVLSNDQSVKTQAWFQKAQELNDSFYWFTDAETGYLYGAKTLTHTEIKTATDIAFTDIGVLVIMFDPQYFLEQIQTTIIGTENSVVTLKLSNSDLQLNTASKTQKYYTQEVALPVGFSVIIQTPKQDINRLSLSYIYMLLLLTTVILLSTILLVRYLSKAVTRPIVTLSQHMENSPTLTPIDTDSIPDNEIRNIYKTYNNLLIRIDKLITEKETETEKRKEQEFATYQLQINPHFLYNTLNTLSCYMMLKEDNTMVSALNILANHLRYNYKEPNAEVAISEELTQLSNYIQIQNIRYRNKIMLKTEIPDEHLNLAVCKMILQPLVENAINYELGRYEESMVIRIFSSIEDDKLKLYVANDLVCEEVNQINDHIEGKINISNHSGGLGTRNINDRLILKYGSEYGLRFYTSDTETVACLTLPIHVVK